jgi:hypothetical protein
MVVRDIEERSLKACPQHLNSHRTYGPRQRDPQQRSSCSLSSFWRQGDPLRPIGVPSGTATPSIRLESQHFAEVKSNRFLSRDPCRHETRLPLASYVAASQLSALRRYEIARVYRRGVGRSAPRELLQGEIHRLSLNLKNVVLFLDLRLN